MLLNMFTISSSYFSAYSTNVFHSVKELKDTPIITYNEFPFAGFTLYCEWSRNHIFFSNWPMSSSRSCGVSSMTFPYPHLGIRHRIYGFSIGPPASTWKRQMTLAMYNVLRLLYLTTTAYHF